MTTTDTTTDPAQQVGRCQRCEQIRPVFYYDRTHDNGDLIWDSPIPPYLPTGAWLCTRHWSAADTVRVNGQSFHVDHMLEVWPWKAAKERLWIAGVGEVLTESDELLRECQAIAAASSGSGGPRAHDNGGDQ